jgi:hypothetical protein
MTKKTASTKKAETPVFIKNRISQLLQQREKDGFKFVPNRDFYNRTNIKQKRWGQLVKNLKPATTEELYEVAKFFKFDYSDIIELETTNT